jgi:tRNA nucleotidyltransferase (CCA-adding enzyme)
MEMKIPHHVEFIIDKLNKAGFEAYAVGGCVRDTLLGRVPGDWDITTSARPEEVKALFHRTIDTGIQHGTVTILMDHVGYEVTTYRIDGEYEDGRHPKQVEFTSNLLEDLKRRDFTINAMAYSHAAGIVDAFDGMGDLRRRTIRCVGDPMERFTEDALRILRAIRFSAQLDFTIEDETWKAISVIAPNIAKVSKERIQVELTKLLLSDHPEKILEVYETGISRYISQAFHEIPVSEQNEKEKEPPILAQNEAEKEPVALAETQRGDENPAVSGKSVPSEKAIKYLRQASSLPREKYIRWAAFLRLTGDETKAVRILKDLKLDNDTISKVKTLVSWSGRPLEADAAAVRHAMSRRTPEVWDALLDLNQYDDEIRTLSAGIRTRGDCLDLKHLAVTGQDLIAAGIKPGRTLGDVLNRLLDLVLDDPQKNKKEILLEQISSQTKPE